MQIIFVKRSEIPIKNFEKVKNYAKYMKKSRTEKSIIK